MLLRHKILCLTISAAAVVFLAEVLPFNNKEIKMPEVKKAEAAADQAVRGFAWSSNIGWISFNSLNCDMNDDEIVDAGAPVGCSSLAKLPAIKRYGVILEADNDLTGFAWSSNIGWISFNWPDIKDVAGSDCPSGNNAVNCQAKLNGTDFQGWARACSVFKTGCSGQLKLSVETGGWDGWIKLRKGADYGVSLSGSDFTGFAYDDDVAGWISFNSKNCDNVAPIGKSDGGQGCPSAGTVMSAYKVYLFSPPYAENLKAFKPDYCSDSPQFSLQWTYKNNSGVNQSKYQLQAALAPADPLFNNPVVDITISREVSPDVADTQLLKVVPAPTASNADFDIAYNQSYYWRIKVMDKNGNWSSNWTEYDDPSPAADDGDSVSKTVTTDTHMWPSVGFTPPDPIAYSINTPITFNAVGNPNPLNKPYYNSVCYDNSNNSVNCKSFEWDFCDGKTCTGKNDNGATVNHTYDVKDIYSVRLKVTDSDGKFCSNPSNSKVLNLGKEKWREAMPK